MKNLVNKKTLATGLGLATGFALYEFLFEDHVDWIKIIVTAVIAIVLLTLFGAFKK